MSSSTIEAVVVSPVPADKAFKFLSNFESIIPKVHPELFKSIDIIEGDGGVGTIKLYRFGDGVPYTSAKYKVDAPFDANSLSYRYTFFEGDVLHGILESVNHHIKVEPSTDGGSVLTHIVVYNSKGEKNLSEEALNFDKEQFVKVFKAIEAYGIAHPDAY